MNEDRKQQNGYSNNGEDTGETTVLSDEEKHDFQGVTIEEDSYGEYKETEANEKSPHSQGWQGRTNEGFGTFKVYTWRDISFVKKVLIGLVLAGILVTLFFFGGIILFGVLVFAIVGMILTLLRSLF